MMRYLVMLAVALAPACGGSSPKPAAPVANTAPANNAPAASARPTQGSCQAMLEHRSELASKAAEAAPNDEATQRQAAIEQARAAGVLGNPSAACPAAWTNAEVDCVMAASTLAAADAWHHP